MTKWIGIPVLSLARTGCKGENPYLKIERIRQDLSISFYWRRGQGSFDFTRPMSAETDFMENGI
ncbi:MAG: hypothetical protein ACKOC1_00875 [Hyphomicrobiales bacterium]